MINGKAQNVYRLPPPTSCPISTSGEPINLRIPQTEKPTVTKVLYNICIIDVVLLRDIKWHTSIMILNSLVRNLSNEL